MFADVSSAARSHHFLVTCPARGAGSASFNVVVQLIDSVSHFTNKNLHSLCSNVSLSGSKIAESLNVLNRIRLSGVSY